mgnify:CR=1 FL=1
MLYSKNRRIVDELIVECNEALFNHYEVALRHTPGKTREEIWEEDLVLAGIIGFTSGPMRGSLVLGIGQKPLEAFDATAGSHRDWIQELANQLLGRMKNRFLAYGVDMQMTTPLSMRGLHLVLEPNAQEAAPMLFHTPDGGAVCVLFDVEFQPGFELVKQSGEENAVPDEGELLLF